MAIVIVSFVLSVINKAFIASVLTDQTSITYTFGDLAYFSHVWSGA